MIVEWIPPTPNTTHRSERPTLIAPPESTTDSPPENRVPNLVPKFLVPAGLGRTGWTGIRIIRCYLDRAGLAGRFSRDS